MRTYSDRKGDGGGHSAADADRGDDENWPMEAAAAVPVRVPLNPSVRPPLGRPLNAGVQAVRPAPLGGEQQHFVSPEGIDPSVHTSTTSLLNAWLSIRHLHAEWRVTPDNRQFACDVFISGQLTGRGSANSKQKAKDQAAEAALKVMAPYLLTASGPRAAPAVAQMTPEKYKQIAADDYSGILGGAPEALIDGVHRNPIQALQEYCTKQKQTVAVQVRVNKGLGPGQNEYVVTVEHAGQSSVYSSHDAKYHKHAACQKVLQTLFPQAQTWYEVLVACGHVKDTEAAAAMASDRKPNALNRGASAAAAAAADAGAGAGAGAAGAAAAASGGDAQPAAASASAADTGAGAAAITSTGPLTVAMAQAAIDGTAPPIVDPNAFVDSDVISDIKARLRKYMSEAFVKRYSVEALAKMPDQPNWEWPMDRLDPK